MSTPYVPWSAGHDVIVNCAAYTKVDDAESHEDAAYAVNATGPAHLAGAAASGARLVQLSTDYVFNGSATEPYPESAPYDPISAYGRTKAAGERLALERNPDGTFVVRTAWLYGEHGPNFAKTMLGLAATKDTWSVVDDQVGQPTWTADLAEQIVAMLDADAAPASTTARMPDARAGSTSRRPSWSRTAWIPRGSPRPTAAPSCARRRVRRTRCSATTRGERLAWHPCATGVRRSPTRSPEECSTLEPPRRAKPGGRPTIARGSPVRGSHPSDHIMRE